MSVVILPYVMHIVVKFKYITAHGFSSCIIFSITAGWNIILLYFFIVVELAWHLKKMTVTMSLLFLDNHKGTDKDVSLVDTKQPITDLQELVE